MDSRVLLETDTHDDEILPMCVIVRKVIVVGTLIFITDFNVISIIRFNYTQSVFFNAKDCTIIVG